MVEKLDETARATLATKLPDWQLEGEHLKRSFRFKDFNEAWGFMNRVALAAEKQTIKWSLQARTASSAAPPHCIPPSLSRRMDPSSAHSVSVRMLT